ncbi:phosphodiester glycosidase family protein [Candidatus Gracilibacteria bacterium]|nr:phosphodiester glycosidase family protein [Candidatus Gracilibacteria bacterium]
MKFFLPFLILFFPITTSAYSFINKTVDGHSVKIFHIPYGDNYHVTAVASNNGTTLKSLITQSNGVAGINGAYFIPRDYTGVADTTNTVRIMNSDGFSFSRYYPDTGINGIFGFDSGNSPILIQNNIYGEKLLRDNYNSGMLLEIKSGIANFPILLANGSNLVPRYDLLGLITPKMQLMTTKSFICRTRDNDIKMGTVSKISMLHFSDFISRFGCIDAINLDNGGSMAMYDKSKYIVGPGRNIMDAFIIVKN